VAFLTEYAVVHRIIRHLELTFVAEKPPPAFGPPWGQESQISAPRESHPLRAELTSHNFRL
jgi:hypothetical protein